MPTARSDTNLDLLRAFAVSLVVIDHTLLANRTFVIGPWQSTWIGVVGVYWFFIHTSLVLMWSLERKPHTLEFYIRRVFRIYPLAIAAIAATLIFHLPIGGSPTNFFHFQPVAPRQILADCLLVQNMIFGNNLIGVMWSLPLEVDMYLLLPVLFFFIRRNFGLWPLLVLWGFAVGIGRSELFRGNVFLTVIPCFLPGLMAYVLFRRTRPSLPAWLFPVFLLAIVALFMQKPSVGRSWPMCLAVGLTLPFFRQITFNPLIRVSHEMAKYSYGIYLTHSIGLVVGFYLLPNQSFLLRVAVTLISTAVLSVAAYHGIEKPLIKLGARLARIAERRYEQRHLEFV